MSDLTRTFKLSSKNCLDGRPVNRKIKYKVPEACVEVTAPTSMLKGGDCQGLINAIELQADKIMSGESRCIIVPEGVTIRFVSLEHDKQNLTTEDTKGR